MTEEQEDFKYTDDFVVEDDSDDNDGWTDTQLMVLSAIRQLNQLLESCWRGSGDRTADVLHDLEIAIKNIGDHVRLKYNVKEVEDFDKLASHYGESGIKIGNILADEYSDHIIDVETDPSDNGDSENNYEDIIDETN